MAWVSTSERSEGRRSEMTDEELRITRVFFVTMGARSDGPHAARTASGVPWVGDAHPTETACRVVSVTPQEAGDALHYDVVVEYSTRPNNQFQPNNQRPNFADRTARVPEIHYGFKTQAVPLEKAYKVECGLTPWATATFTDFVLPVIPVRNTAGEPPDPPVERAQYIPYVRVTRDEATYSNPTMMEYIGHVNKTTWNGGAPGTVLLEGVTADRMFEASTFYWRVTYDFVFNPLTWARIILNDGFRYIPSAGVVKEIKDGNGEPITRPRNLTAAGAVNTSLTSFYWLWIQGEPTAEFANLNISLA